MSFRQPTLPSPQELRDKTYHRGYAADDGTRVMYQRDWAKQHLLEGDGLLPLFYDHLSKIDRSHEQRLRGVSLPDTVVYEHNFPRAWYGWDRETQEIIKRPGRDLDARTIFAEFCERKDKKCDIIAQYCYVRGAEAADEEVGGTRRRGGGLISKSATPARPTSTATGANDGDNSSAAVAEQIERERRRREKEMQRVYHPDTCVEFFTKETLYSFLTNPKPKPDGVLQRFVIPKGKASSRHNFQLQAIWSPVVTLVYKRTNRHLLGDTTIGVSQRAPTFDGPPHLSTESLVAGSTLNRIDIVCRAIADHITFTEKKPIERLICYFKEDDEDRLWLMWASSLRVGGDQLNPVHVRVPMNLALRVETIRTILPKAEAIKASTELAGGNNDDDMLLAKDVQLFDMTGDKDFARKCGGDLFPVIGNSDNGDEQVEDDQKKNNQLSSARATAASGGMKSTLVVNNNHNQDTDSSLNKSHTQNHNNVNSNDDSISNLENTTSTQQQHHASYNSTTTILGASCEQLDGQNNNNINNNNNSPGASTARARSSHKFNRFNPQNYPNCILPPSILLEKMERDQQILQQQQQLQTMDDGSYGSDEHGGNNNNGSANNGSNSMRRRRSPPGSVRKSAMNNNNNNNNNNGGDDITSEFGSMRSTSARNNANTARSNNTNTHNNTNNNANGSDGASPRIFISPRAPFLALSHAPRHPTIRDQAHPFHRAMLSSEHEHYRTEQERKLNREVGRSARKPPAGIVLLPGYKEACALERRRRLSFHSASKAIEDEERLKGELLRNSLDIMYEAHSTSLASARFISNDFQVSVPPLLTLCLDENELESLCRVMGVKSAQLINTGFVATSNNNNNNNNKRKASTSGGGGGGDVNNDDENTLPSGASRRGSMQPGSSMKNVNGAGGGGSNSVKVVVTVPAGVSGRGRRLDRPLVQLHDDIKEFFDYMFLTKGQVLWDRYCGGAM